MTARDRILSGSIAASASSIATARFATLGEKRNACIEAASGSLIAVWDDDDVYLPWRLSYTVRAMRENRTHFYRAAEFWAYWGEAKLHDNQSVPGWIGHQNTLFSKELWREVNGYPPHNIGEDAEFFARVHRLLGQEFIKYPIETADRFFIMREPPQYAHASIGGGSNPLDLSPGRRVVVPCSIADPLLRTACEKLIAANATSVTRRIAVLPPRPHSPAGGTPAPKIKPRKPIEREHWRIPRKAEK